MILFTDFLNLVRRVPTRTIVLDNDDFTELWNRVIPDCRHRACDQRGPGIEFEGRTIRMKDRPREWVPVSTLLDGDTDWSDRKLWRR